MRNTFARLALVAMASITAGYATTISDGQTITPAPTITAPTGITEATISNESVNFANTGNPLSATFSETVLLDSVTGSLDYLFTFKDTSTGTGSQYPGVITAVSMASFINYTANVGYVNGSGVAPGDVFRSGDVIQFDFNSSQFGPGDTSDELVIETNSSQYGAGTVGVAGGADGGAVAYGPLAANAPEPITMSLMGAGLLLFGAFRWRRNSAN